MVRELADLRILLTGASSGIGLCLAEKLAAAGSHLALAARSKAKLQEIAANLATNANPVVVVPGDLAEAADRRRIVETAVSQLGGLDVLINNAGVASFGHFSGSTEELLRQIMEVNFFAPAELIRLAIPHLAQGRVPAIVNVSSMCGRRGLPAWPEYSASKFALCGLTEALRGELARFDIDVLLVVPGLTQTQFGAHLLRNEGRMKVNFSGGMPPQGVADAILKTLVRNRTEVVLGREARWILRINRFLPRLVDRLMARKVRQLYA